MTNLTYEFSVSNPYGNPETYSEPCEASKIEVLCENGLRLFPVKYFRQTLHLRCLTGFSIPI